MRVQLPVERTRSRSGLHARTSVVVALVGGKVRVLSEPEKLAKGTYSRGKAGLVSVNLGPGDVAVLVTLTMNPRKAIKGYLTVYDHQGREVLRVKYSRFKLRLSRGDASYSWAAERAVEALGLAQYVRRRNYGLHRAARGPGKEAGGGEGGQAALPPR